MARPNIYCSKIYISRRFDVAVAKSPLHSLTPAGALFALSLAFASSLCGT